MSKNEFTRRSFMKAAGASPAIAAAIAREPVVTETYPVRSFEVSKEPIQVVTRNRFLDEELEKIIRAGGDTEVRIKVCKDRQEFQANLKDAEVVFGHISGEELNLAPKLKWVQYNAAGVNFLMEDQKFRESPVVLTNQAGTFAPGISETAIGLLLCLTRGITKYYMPMFYKRALERVGTPASDHHIELAGKTMAIVGMGGIGSAVARRAHYGFDMRIIGIDAKPLPRPDYVEELHDPGWFPEMVPQADVLVAAAPQTPETQGMFSEKVFRSMKRTSYFLGLSRGDLFDDMALVRALKEGWIAGAGLDVFPQEPPPSDHPIYDCSNVVMTPHTSGWGPDRQVRFVNVFAENIRRYATGLPLMNVVDKKRMY